MYKILIKNTDDVESSKLQQSLLQTMVLLSSVTSVAQTSIVTLNQYIRITTARGSKLQPDTFINYMYTLLDFANKHRQLLLTMEQTESVVFKLNILNDIVIGIKSQIMLVLEYQQNTIQGAI